MNFIDTNILVFAFNKGARAKHEKARNLLEQFLNGQKQGIISIQILSEFYVVITKKISNPLSSEEGEEIIQEIINSPIGVLNFNEKTVVKAIKLSRESGVHYWDCLIGTTMKENNIEKIYTDNVKDFKEISDLEVINPFKED